MSFLQLDAALGGRSQPPAPLTSSRYPAKPGQKKQFTFQQQQKQRQSLANIALSHSTSFSPALTPTNQQLQSQPSTPSAAAATHTADGQLIQQLPPHLTAPPLTFFANAGAASLNSTSQSLSSTQSLAPTTASATTKSSRIPAFQLEKFLTSNQHLSTAAERLAASLILKKDSRKRTSADMSQVAKFLQTIDAFRGLTLSVCVDLAAACRIRKYNREEVVYREGDDAVNFYVIMRGSVGTRINPQLSHATGAGMGAGLGGGEEKESSSDGYIAGIEYAGSSLGSDSFSSSLLPRHSSTRMALERSELLVLNVSDYTSIMRLHQREEEKQRMHLLKHIKCFELCTTDELWQIAQHMQPLHLPKNAVVFTQGEVAATLYFIESGECRAVYNTPASGAMYLDCGRMRQYSFFGELGLWQDGRDGRGVRTCSVYCETTCVLYAMTYDSFRARVPKFVVATMREWGDVLYGKEGNGELAAAVRAEQKWKAWKERILKDLKKR